jgi:predicted enzyme related to lactoylglutathione lyase
LPSLLPSSREGEWPVLRLLAFLFCGVGQPADGALYTRRKRGDRSMGNSVMHFEIGCRDRAKAEEFYSALFDWSIFGQGPASIIQTGSDEGIGGHITSLGHEPHHYTMFYVEVEDVTECLKKAESLGGKKIVGPIPIPTGTFAWFADPEGNAIGLLQKKA